MKLIDLFAGCGGFGHGFTEAGFVPAWANEIDRHARASYEANHPGVYVDPREIERVKATDILSRAGLAVGEAAAVIGGWPCVAFSKIGPRSARWDGAVERLCLEFVRVVDGVRPLVSVGENVAGMAQGASIGWLKIFEREMDAIGYRVAVRELDAADFDVPQHRRRLIFVGVRSDLAIGPADVLGRLVGRRRVGVRDVLPWVEEVEFYNRRPGVRSADLPMPTLCASDRNWLAGRAVDGTIREFTIDELKLLSGFPSDYVLKGSPQAQRRQLGNCLPPPLAREIATALRPVFA